ncbi:HNH endonuclease domain-containing protein [Hymenobacter sp. UYP22]|uniref:HNH endonuclease domain-containing protein n=1 Tax=Hymenobacter sp. UYP22 TaxID=3156348 RepID=UPI003397B9A2
MKASHGEQIIAAILKHDSKTTSYKIALLRSINDVVLMYPDMARGDLAIAIPLRRLAELWVAYYWPFADEFAPIYQGARAVVSGSLRNDLAFRPALTALQLEWKRTVQLSAQAGDGFFLQAEMRTPRRRKSYSQSLQSAYDTAVAAAGKALLMPIKFAGPGHWSIFAQPIRCDQLPGSVHALPGTQLNELCLVVPGELWAAFHRLSLYVEALCIHEWCLFTEGVTQDPGRNVTRGEVYTMLTTRPDNRRPLSWERNQIDILLHENVQFTCPWTQKILSSPQQYDLDHLLPLTIYPINELWNLLPVDRQYNQHTKRDRIPDAPKLAAAEPWLRKAYANYRKLATLHSAVQEDALLRFSGLEMIDFEAQLARRAVRFIEEVATARFAQRF